MAAPIGRWRWMANDVVTVEAYTGQNKHGEATYGAAVTYMGHCQGDSRRVLDATGLERVGQVRTYLIGNVALTPRDRITLPSRFNPSQPPIISVGQESNERGWHHTVVVTG